MKKLKLMAISFIALFGLVAVLPGVAMAQSPADDIQSGVDQISPDEGVPSLGSQIQIIVNILLFILGAIAVVMIVIGGIRYATSGGDSSQITSAKNTILYAVVGLVVAILAYAIVNFILDQFVS